MCRTIQVSGLGIHFLNTTLEEPGLYATKELYRHTISKSLPSHTLYLKLALQLLCFRYDCVSKSNTMLDHPQVQPSELTEKQESIRVSWNPPRSN
ncbi:hypothetical protein BD770DRAFT_383905 [Pilaira anomala]|nr:hypothetical protein BD770DRAFT_383905 [Pilaira anomala]